MSDFELFINSIKSDYYGEIEKNFYLEFVEQKDWATPLHYACFNGRVELVKLFLWEHCKFDIVASGNQPIYLACENGYIDIAKILIETKCDNNASNKGSYESYIFLGYKPIHLACRNGHIDIVKILIENKCDINSRNLSGYQPIHLACENDHIDIVKIFFENNCVMYELSKIALITKTMVLNCKEGCDHLYCEKSLENETFKKREFIGRGKYGKVYKYKISNTNREIVIKRTKSNCEDTKYIEGNINKYSFCIVHKHIVQYLGGLMLSGKPHIFMEYTPLGSLKDLIDKSKQIENAKVIKFSKHIMKGLKFIHSEGIIHRDIKPDNMLLDQNETLKLADFGCSISLRPVSIDQSIIKIISLYGTPNYVAPEVINSEPYDFKADIWSTGASIIHMITGKMPYYWLPPADVMFTIGTTKKIEIIDCPPISETMQSFIDDLLTPEQSNRPSAEILLKHDFFSVK